MKKDTVQIIITGINLVDWKTTPTDCFVKGAVGVLPDTGVQPESMIGCVMWDKNLV